MGQPGPGSMLHGGGSLEPWPTHLHGTVGMKGTGSNVQAPGPGLTGLQSGGAGGPRSHCSAVGLGRKPRPGSSSLFPRQRRGRNWEEQALDLGFIWGLSSLLSDESSLSPALTRSLLTGSPEGAVEGSSGIKPKLSFLVCPPASFTLPSHSAVAPRLFLGGQGVDQITWKFSQNTDAWLFYPAHS